VYVLTVPPCRKLDPSMRLETFDELA
jgi:hypothetical protein